MNNLQNRLVDCVKRWGRQGFLLLHHLTESDLPHNIWVKKWGTAGLVSCNLCGGPHSVLALNYAPIKQIGVNDGTRTRNIWHHNPELYQLSYEHHKWLQGMDLNHRSLAYETNEIPLLHPASKSLGRILARNAYKVRNL